MIFDPLYQSHGYRNAMTRPTMIKCTLHTRISTSLTFNIYIYIYIYIFLERMDTSWFFFDFRMISVARSSSRSILWQWVNSSSQRRAMRLKDLHAMNKGSCKSEIITFGLDMCRVQDYSLSWRVFSVRYRDLRLNVQWSSNIIWVVFPVNDRWLGTRSVRVSFVRND